MGLYGWNVAAGAFGKGVGSTLERRRRRKTTEEERKLRSRESSRRRIRSAEERMARGRLSSQKAIALKRMDIDYKNLQDVNAKLRAEEVKRESKLDAGRKAITSLYEKTDDPNILSKIGRLSQRVESGEDYQSDPKYNEIVGLIGRRKRKAREAEAASRKAADTVKYRGKTYSRSEFKQYHYNPALAKLKAINKIIDENIGGNESVMAKHKLNLSEQERIVSELKGALFPDEFEVNEGMTLEFIRDKMTDEAAWRKFRDGGWDYEMLRKLGVDVDRVMAMIQEMEIR